MTSVPELDAAPVTGVHLIAAPEEFSALHATDCAATVWHRPLPPAFQNWIEALPADNLPRARLVLRPDEVPRAVEALCAEAGLSDSPERSWLIEDIAGMARRFADVMRAPFLRLRLDVVTTNACRKFHVDALTARLVCTYRGTATQYGTGTPEADPAQIVTVPTGAPFLMRGTLWPETPGSGLRHRSPPIEGSGETRLLLVLDPIHQMPGPNT